MSPRSRTGRKQDVPGKVLVDQHDRIRGAHTRIPGKTSQHGIGLREGVPTQSEGTAARPQPDRLMRLMRCDQ